uniref:Uncharacterized protein n=1 Tax=Kalanchoe fedtschenkoi TaxID=63787 RepID=A0A7N0VA85_KALFE
MWKIILIENKISSFVSNSSTSNDYHLPKLMIQGSPISNHHFLQETQQLLHIPSPRSKMTNQKPRLPTMLPAFHPASSRNKLKNVTAFSPALQVPASQSPPPPSSIAAPSHLSTLSAWTTSPSLVTGRSTSQQRRRPS